MKRIKLYDATQIDKSNLMFTNQMLKLLLIPLVVEQMLNSFMGMADTMMVSNVGSAAMSAVSLVDSINILVVQVFSALATGATIICSQYLGRKDREGSNKAAKQIFITVLFISIFITVCCLVFRKPLLLAVFGAVEEKVMLAAIIYFFITALSYPFIALFNVGSAFYRATGNAKFPMKISVISNFLNIFLNYIFIFIFNLGIAGAALATLISRIFCALTVFYYLRNSKNLICIRNYFSIRLDFTVIGKVLAIGIPAGIETGMFQFGKLAIQSTVSTLGTSAIAAQAITIIFENVNGIVGVGVGIGLMTVVGQCIGAGRKEEAKYYIVKLTFLAEIGMIISCLAVFFVATPIMRLANMEPESMAISLGMVTAITIVKPLVWVLSFVPPYGMRAAGDVKFSMIVATLTMWFCRVLLSIFFIKVLKVGPIGVWYGMFVDWTIRGIIFTHRYFSGKWLNKEVI